MTLKVCNRCKEAKPKAEFGVLNSTKDKLNTNCKPCKRQTEKDYFHGSERARFKRSADNRKWRFGMTQEQFDEKLKDQNYLCCICKINLDKSSLHRTPHVDHCHSTEKVRGLLCSECNKGLGHFYDDQDALLNAVQYLRKYHG